MQKNKHGFTLIELLVVVGVIAVLMAIAVPNFLGARDRANDLKRKAELAQLKNALRIYYNDYNVYPSETNQNLSNSSFNGCGASGIAACSAGSTFSTGTPPNDVIYMKVIPDFNGSAGGGAWTYRATDPSLNFCLWTTLSNGSDSDLLASQTKCSACDVAGMASNATDFIVCAD